MAKRMIIKNWVTIAQAARILEKNRATLTRYAEKGVIVARRTGWNVEKSKARGWEIHRDEIKRIQRCGICPQKRDAAKLKREL